MRVVVWNTDYVQHSAVMAAMPLITKEAAKLGSDEDEGFSSVMAMVAAGTTSAVCCCAMLTS